MAKPIVHAESSVKQWGGAIEDYLPIHDWFDETKAIFSDNRHRALRHHSEGIFLCEKIFGHTITNSNHRQISVRSIAEQHVLEDFNGLFIPTAQDYLQEMEYRDWMNGRGYPVSAQRIESYRKHKVIGD